MRDKSFHTTTSAEFRELAEAARVSGRLPELIQAISDRLERYRALLQTHQTGRDFQSTQQTKKLIANLENKLQLALELQDSNSPDI
jgi:uncharacterized membrane-anchored protein